jgi:hypothetical protein
VLGKRIRILVAFCCCGVSVSETYPHSETRCVGCLARGELAAPSGLLHPRGVESPECLHIGGAKGREHVVTEWKEGEGPRL